MLPPQSLNHNLLIMKRRGSSSLSPRELMEDVHDLKKQQLEDLRTHTEEQRKEGVYPPWSDLHISILDNIFCKLSGDDKGVFRSICSSWLQVEQYQTPNFHLPLITYQESANTCTFRSLQGKSRAVDLPGTYEGAFICASAFGWLLMVRHTTKVRFLLNPITRARIDLPSWLTYSCLFNAACISSSPTDPNCLVVFLVGNAVVSCRLDDHKPEWSITRTGEHNSSNVWEQFEMVGCNGNIYVLTNWGKLGVIGGGKKLALTWLIDAPANLSMEERCDDYYLLESSGEILMVAREGEYLAIYKANLVMRRWKRIRALDENRVLFLGHGSSFSASTAEIGGSGDLIYLLFPPYEEKMYRDKMKVVWQHEWVEAEGRWSWGKIAGSTKVVTVPSSNSFWILRYRHLVKTKF